MKTCPFCAEEIQDAAIVCKHCGRDLADTHAESQIVAAPRVSTPEKKKGMSAGAGCLTVITILIVLAVIGSIVGSNNHAPAPAAAIQAQPDEPCIIEGSASAKADMAPWCQGGIFTDISVKSDASHLVITMQFSRKGFAGWQANHVDVLDRFGGLTDQMARVTPGAIAIALFGPDGKMAGGCTRTVGAPRTNCAATP